MVLTPADVPKYISEFVGTFVLVLTVGCNVLSKNADWGATSIAFSLMVMIYALGGVSGAHFNPAVTLAVTASGKMNGGAQQCIVYMLVQVFGGLAAALTYTSIFKASFNLAPQGAYTNLQADFVELLYTFMLCFVVLNVACCSASKNNQYYGLAIGSVIIAGGYAVGGISGGAFNPAVALGIDLASVSKGFGHSISYTIWQFIGALAAAGAFRLVRPEDFAAGPAGQLSSKLLSEFIGTYFLVVTLAFNVLGGSTAGAWSIAASLMVMIYALGNCSGAHFNPAVTACILMSGRNKISLNDALWYVLAQTLGGVAAGLTTVTLLQRSAHLGPAGGHTWAHAATAEIIFTAVLCFVVLSVATTATPSRDMFGLAIGSTITVAGFAVGGVSGAALNPAVAFGIDTADAFKGAKFGDSILYTVFELVGAALAATVFYGTRPGEYTKEGAAKAALPVVAK
jgi:aquaporin Z